MRVIKPFLFAFLAILVLASCAGKKRYEGREYSLAVYPGTEQTIEIRGIRITFIDESPSPDWQGVPILFIHGLSGDISDWEANIPYFKDKRRVLALDLPGHGKSEKRNDIPYGRALFTEVVSEFLKARGVESAIVVGNSMGGMTSASLALAHPEQVRILILSDPAGIPFYPWIVRKSSKLLTPGMVHHFWANPRTMERTGGNAFAHPENYPRRRIEEDIALILQPDAKQYSYAVARSLQDAARQDMREELKNIKCPTLIIWGEKDTIVPTKYAKEWHEAIPASELIIVPDAGHIPMLEAPEIFNKAVEEFIGKNL